MTEHQKFESNNFDALRLLAAIQVVIGHLTIHLNVADPWWMALVGHFPGVPIFFVISGFLIASSFERSSSTSRYFTKRALRIFPALWCCLLITAAVVLLLGFSASPLKFTTWLFAQLIGLIYTPGFLKDFGFGSYNGSLWTIPVELQFYVILPLIYFMAAKVKSRNGVFVLAFLMALAAILAIRLIYPQFGFLADPATFTEKLLKYLFVPHIYIFFFGVLLYRFKLYASPLIVGRIVQWLIFYALICYLVPVESPWYIVKSLVLACVVLSAAYSFTGFSSKVLRGYDISYGVYIYHGLILNVFIHFGADGSFKTIAAIVVLTAIVGMLSWLLVERRCIQLKSRGALPAPGASVAR